PDQEETGEGERDEPAHDENGKLPGREGVQQPAVHVRDRLLGRPLLSAGGATACTATSLTSPPPQCERFSGNTERSRRSPRGLQAAPTRWSSAARAISGIALLLTRGCRSSRPSLSRRSSAHAAADKQQRRAMAAIAAPHPVSIQ